MEVTVLRYQTKWEDAGFIQDAYTGTAARLLSGSAYLQDGAKTAVDTSSSEPFQPLERFVRNVPWTAQNRKANANVRDHH